MASMEFVYKFERTPTINVPIKAQSIYRVQKILCPYHEVMKVLNNTVARIANVNAQNQMTRLWQYIAYIAPKSEKRKKMLNKVCLLFDTLFQSYFFRYEAIDINDLYFI